MHKNIIFTAIAAVAFMIFSGGAVHAAYAPNFSGMPDFTFPQDSGTHARFIDLSSYASDAPYNGRQFAFAIISQSNNRTADCYLESNYFVSCSMQAGQYGTSTLTIRATSPTGMHSESSFNVTSMQATPQPGQIRLTVDTDSVTMQRGQAVNVQASVANNSKGNECFTASANMGSQAMKELTAILPPSGFCLAAGQSTKFSLTIGAKKDALAGRYGMELALDYGSGTLRQPIMATVSDSALPLKVTRASPYLVCNEPYGQDIRIMLENNSGAIQAIRLTAYNDTLLPEVEFPNPTLYPGQAIEMNVKLHVNESTQPGEYTLSFLAESQGRKSESAVAVRLDKCREAFTLEVAPRTRQINAGSEATYTIYLKSDSDKDTYVMLSSDANITTRLSANYLLLTARSTQRITLTASPPSDAKSATHTLNVSAWNADATAQATAQAIVYAQRDIEMIVANNSFGARACSAQKGQVFEVMVKNNSTRSQTLAFSLSGVPRSVEARLSDTALQINAGSEKKLYVFINPGIDAATGNYTIRLNAAGISYATQELNFKVVEAGAQAGVAREGMLQVTGYPREISLLPGEKKLLIFTVKNTSNARIENVKVSLYGTGSDAYFFPLAIGSLAPLETREIKREIEAAPGITDKVYSATLEVKADGHIATKPITVRIGSEAQAVQERAGTGENGNGMLGTAFGILSSGGPAMLGVILIIVLVALIILVSLLNSNKSSSVLP